MPSLNTHPLHLGLGATAVVQPFFTGEMAWYMEYGARHGGDGAEGRLVTTHHFSESWTSWEMHPHGDEVVYCISGAITLRQQVEGANETHITLAAGDYAINAPGVWHTADVVGEAMCLFITAGLGTTHKPR